jgi:hypothetical protein
MFPMTGVQETFLGLSVVAAISIWVAWLEFNSQQRKQKQISATAAPAQPRLRHWLNREIIRPASQEPFAG